MRVPRFSRRNLMSTVASTRTALPTGTWNSDPTHSTIDFTVKHMLVGKFRASVPTFSATLVVDDAGSAKLEDAVRSDHVVGYVPLWLAK